MLQISHRKGLLWETFVSKGANIQNILERQEITNKSTILQIENMGEQSKYILTGK